MDAHSLGHVYSSKTDDELLALVVERTSLEPEAQSILSSGLRRRKLTDPRVLHHRATEQVAPSAQNPAFNFPARVAGSVMLLGCAGFLLTFIIAVAQVHQLFKFILALVLVWGPIFTVIAWATRRSLRNPALKNQARKERKAKSPIRVL